MGAKNHHTVRSKQQEYLDKLRTQITSWYIDERLTSIDIQEKLKANGLDLTVGQVQFAFYRFGLKRDRNTRSEKLLTALRQKEYTAKTCEHCHGEFKPTCSIQRFCAVCSPDRTFWKRIVTYGIGKPQFDVMMERQESKCAICCQSLLTSTAHIDHDHKTLEIRGLLCGKCNLRLAVIEDVEFVRNAQQYLECNSSGLHGTVKVK